MLDQAIQIVRLAGRTALRAAIALVALGCLAVGVGPLTGTYRTLTVLTGSMAPQMPPGSMAIVMPVDPATLEVGDVITYQAPLADHRVVTHRVFKILEHGAHPIVITKGDANTSPDPWTARITSSPAWRRVAVVPYAGTAIRVLRSSWLHRLLVYALPALLLILWLRRIWLPDTEAHPTAVGNAEATWP